MRIPKQDQRRMIMEKALQLLFGLYAVAVLFFTLLLPLVPAVIRKHDNYYEP